MAHTLPYEFALAGPFRQQAPLPHGYYDSVTAQTLMVSGDKSYQYMRNAQPLIAQARPRPTREPAWPDPRRETQGDRPSDCRPPPRGLPRQTTDPRLSAAFRRILMSGSSASRLPWLPNSWLGVVGMRGSQHRHRRSRHGRMLKSRLGPLLRHMRLSHTLVGLGPAGRPSRLGPSIWTMDTEAPHRAHGFEISATLGIR